MFKRWVCLNCNLGFVLDAAQTGGASVSCPLCGEATNACCRTIYSPYQMFERGKAWKCWHRNPEDKGDFRPCARAAYGEAAWPEALISPTIPAWVDRYQTTVSVDSVPSGILDYWRIPVGTVDRLVAVRPVRVDEVRF